MLASQVEGESVTVELHPKGKHIRVTCSCTTVPDGMPCAHIIEGLTMWDDLEGEDDELEVLEKLFDGDDGSLAEEIEDYVRDLGQSLAGLAEAEQELEKGRRERDRQERQLAVEFGRDQVRDAKSDVKESEKILRDASRRLVRLINGLGKTGRVPAGWPTPGIPPERVKELEAESLAQLRDDAEERARKEVEASKPATSGGCGAAAGLILAAVLLATACVV